MNPRRPGFRQSARIALEDVRLSTALESATGRFRSARETAIAEFPGVEDLRDHFKHIREATVKDLGRHLRIFEESASAAGAQVHFAEDAAAAREVILDIVRKNGVKLVTKSKSMATEEIRLNHALEDAGIRAVETDLGEWIVQLAEEPPSHIIAPAIHKTKEQVAELFSAESGSGVASEISELTTHARLRLRELFLSAGVGISGGNIAVAETGSVVLVTNEGNGRMVTSLPRVHIALIGIEKVAPTWHDAGVWLALLARSATGQPLSIYTSVITGPKRSGDIDGPEEVHIVFLDNGRSRLLNTQYEEILQCIRCGACLNICPVYRVSGGHAYCGEDGEQSPYSGPIGAVVAPLLFGLDNFKALPQASTLCGACRDVCPARIDLPRMLLALRMDSVEAGLVKPLEAALERTTARVFSNEQLFEIAARFGRIGQRFLRVDLPEIAPRSFRKWWAEEGK